MTKPSSRASRLPPPALTGDLLSQIGPLPDEALETVQQIIRERDHLFQLHEALIEVERAGSLSESLRIFVDAIRRIGFGRVVVSLRDADFEPTLIISAGLSEEEDRSLRLNPASGAVWRKRLPDLERFRVSHSWYLDATDDWVAAEFHGSIPSSLTAGDDPEWSPRDTLIVPLRGRDGAILALLILDDPVDRRRPSLARIRAVELFAQQMGYLIEQTRLSEISARRAERLQVLHEVGSVLARSLDEQELINELARQVARILPAEGIVVARPIEDGAMVETLFRTVRGKERPRAPHPIGRGAISEVIRTGRAVRVTDWETERSPLVSADDVVGDGGPVGSLLAVPMIIGSELVAVLAVYTSRRAAYGIEEEEILLTVGSQAATSLINARHYGESQRERRQSEALAEVARAIGGSLRLNEVLDLTLRHAIALTRATGAMVTLRVGSTDELHVVAAVGSAATLQDVRFPMSMSVSGRVIREGRPVITNDAPADPDAYRPTVKKADIRKIVLVPLITRDETIGVLAVQNRAIDFDDADVRILQRLGDYVAVAIVNARLFEDVNDAEREWEIAFDAVGSGLVVLDAAGRITRCNARAVQVAGVESSAELVGKAFHEIILGAREPVGDDAAQRALREHRIGRSRQWSGSPRRLFDIVAAPHPSGGAVVTFDDVTALHMLAERHRRVIETSNDAIVITGLDRRIAFVNPAAERLFRHPESLIGRPVAELVPAEYTESVREREDAALSGEPQRYEAVLLCGDGSRRAVSISTAPLLELDEITGIVASLRDVTEEKRLTEQLLQQEKLAAIGQLVSGVAHELNNPLAGVLAFAQLLQASLPPGSELAPAVETIQQETRRAAKIVANLLTFARQHQPQRTIADLNQVLLDTIELRRYALRMQQIEIDIELDQRLPTTWADPFQLQQVILNLITNAEHAMLDVADDRRMKLSTRFVAPDGIELAVGDTGTGVSPENIDRIFNPFFTTKAVGKGTGLGLSISDGIVREHGGRIRVESPAGGGATFTVELPVTHPPGSSPAVEPDRERRSIARRILLLDDERSIRSGIATYLSSAGHRVTAVASGDEALQAIREADFDVVLLDMGLPDIATEELFNRIRDTNGSFVSRIIFLTSDASGDAPRAFLKRAGRPHLAKPFQLEDLTAAIAALPER